LETSPFDQIWSMRFHSPRTQELNHRCSSLAGGNHGV
jgi:hypothetical protein